MNSPGTQYLFDHPELWASPEDHRAALRDSRIYGVSFSQRNANGLLKRIDPTTVTPDSVGAEVEVDRHV